MSVREQQNSIKANWPAWRQSAVLNLKGVVGRTRNTLLCLTEDSRWGRHIKHFSEFDKFPRCYLALFGMNWSKLVANKIVN
jgi:hypothetical protein